MTHFTIDATSRTPSIQLDDKAGTLIIAGESYPEDVRRFYATLSEQLAVFFSTRPERLHVTIKLTYFNSGSARALMELIDQLEDAAKKEIEVKVSWYCDPDDDIIREFAEDIALDAQAASVQILDLDGDTDR
jgi:hypothetical protein